jgi:DNA-binding IclR family transcriptional regulator
MMSKRTATDASSSQTVERAMRLLLEIGSDDQGGLSLTECATRLKYSKPTTLRILRTLERAGMVTVQESTGRYRLGLTTLRLGMAYLDGLDLRQAALPTMHELARYTKETVHLGTLVGSQVVYIEKVEGSHAVRMFSRIGHTMPAHSTAVGKAILAFLPPDTVDEALAGPLPGFTSTTITDHAELAAHLDETRLRGYAIDNVENEEGITCVGAPVFDHTGVATAALSIAAPTQRMPSETVAEYGALVRDKALALSDVLGYRGVTTAGRP